MMLARRYAKGVPIKNAKMQHILAVKKESPNAVTVSFFVIILKSFEYSTTKSKFKS